MVHPRKCSMIFSRMPQLLPFIRILNMHQDTKSALLIAVCKRTLIHCQRLAGKRRLAIFTKIIMNKKCATYKQIHTSEWQSCLYNRKLITPRLIGCRACPNSRWSTGNQKSFRNVMFNQRNKVCFSLSTWVVGRAFKISLRYHFNISCASKNSMEHAKPNRLGEWGGEWGGLQRR